MDYTVHTTNDGVVLAEIPLSKLFILRKYQRDERPAQVNKAAREWDDEIATAIVVCKRGDRYHVADGQNRYLAKQKKYKDDPSRTILCIVSQQSPAELFEKLNDPRGRSNAGYHVIFWVRLNDGAKREGDIGRVCERNNIELVKSRKFGGTGNFCSALKALRDAYDRLSFEQFKTMAAILHECFDNGEALKDPFIKGLALYLRETRHDHRTVFAKLKRSRKTAGQILTAVARTGVSNSRYFQGVYDHLERICK